MEKMNLKKGLFGYTQSSVQEYVHALNNEMTARNANLVRDNDELKKKCELFEDQINAEKDKQQELIDKIDVLTKKLDAIASEKSQLDNQIDNLNKKLEIESMDKTNYLQGQNELADVMLDAKRFADDMKRKTELEYEQKKAINDDKINQEKVRIRKYISDIDELSDLLRKVCNDFGKEIETNKKDLRLVLNNLSAINSKSEKNIQ